jgi:hypothetical protein
VSGAAEDDSVGDGQHVPAGSVDYSLLVDADQMHLRVSYARAVADRLGQAPGVSHSRMRDDSYSCLDANRLIGCNAMGINTIRSLVCHRWSDLVFDITGGEVAMPKRVGASSASPSAVDRMRLAAIEPLKPDPRDATTVVA